MLPPLFSEVATISARCNPAFYPLSARWSKHSGRHAVLLDLTPVNCSGVIFYLFFFFPPPPPLPTFSLSRSTASAHHGRGFDWKPCTADLHAILFQVCDPVNIISWRKKTPSIYLDGCHQVALRARLWASLVTTINHSCPKKRGDVFCRFLPRGGSSVQTTCPAAVWLRWRALGYHGHGGGQLSLKGEGGEAEYNVLSERGATCYEISQWRAG